MARKQPRRSRQAGRYAYDGLERVIHEKARVGILTSLATHSEGLLFAELKSLCSLTDGNLNRHLQVLVEAGLVEAWKRASGSRHRTLVRLTAKGRRRLLEYVAELERVVHDALEATEGATRPAERGGETVEGWSPA